ncbi:hypothetical protein CLIB1444_08S04566 [[Candida] jaroonii]|uniref:Uncharacterized protein n=1 Tax=[Candida] jaroonii TaxID=467808 RepID=A0ACA9YB82_9ASCO|nr:hypothetical protein CLIB1444_08S04566 [[Candida] jaroonii]
MYQNQYNHLGSNRPSSHYFPMNHPQPTSSHYLPPSSQSQNQPVQVLQPTMVGMIPPPPPPQQHQMIQQNNYMPNLMMAPQMNHVLPIHYQIPPILHQQPMMTLQNQIPIQMPPNHQNHMQGGQLNNQFPPQNNDNAVTGGINSVLEYDLPTMSTFLSWCTFGMLKQNRNPTKDFENLINSVLIATRLPKSTIIIALEYLNQRFSKKEIDSLNESEIFIRLIVALILGNKFNDDNTFTNRSWCGATGLEIELINSEEKIWLKEINWELNVVNFESNILTLEECWKTWLDKYTNESLPSSPNFFNYNNEKSTSPDYRYQPSIPSSPISINEFYSNNLNLSSSRTNLNDTSPVSPIKDSIWSMNSQNNFQNQPNQNIWSYNNENYVAPAPYVNSNFVGYANPYYTYNMASC